MRIGVQIGPGTFAPPGLHPITEGHLSERPQQYLYANWNYGPGFLVNGGNEALKIKEVLFDPQSAAH